MLAADRCLDPGRNSKECGHVENGDDEVKHDVAPTISI